VYLSSDPIDDFILRQILDAPEHLFPEPDRSWPSDGVILDVGGHHGFHAVEMLRRYPGRDLIVVEPHPAWCRLIRKNVRANGGEHRTRIINGCLAEDNEPRVLKFDPNSSWGASVYDRNGNETVVQVASVTLPQVLEQRRVALVYCNAEGAEFALIPQIAKLKQRPPKVVLCTHPEFGDEVALRGMLRQMGYSEANANGSERRPIFHYSLTEAA
jgi:FkbM family methyltransferase